MGNLLGTAVFALALLLQMPEARRVDFDNESCTGLAVTVLDTAVAQIVGRCTLVDSSRVTVELIVRNRGGAQEGALYGFNLRFCGKVLQARGPRGWVVSVKRESTRAAEAADVGWQVPGTLVRSRGIHPRREMSGFTLVVQGAWRLGLGYGFTFQQAVRAGASPHDCADAP